MREPRGAYTAERAAALSGVPWSTVHEWARSGVLEPSVSPRKVKLWSHSDLFGLRIIYWLRHPKPHPDEGNTTIPATPMKHVRKALADLRELDLDLVEGGDAMLRVDRRGELHVGPAGASYDLRKQKHLETLDLVKPFVSEPGIEGPDLFRPRAKLRIAPGKLAGAPHIEQTRLETEALWSLASRGITPARIHHLYPQFEPDAIDQAIDLEAQLAKNLQPRPRAAAAG